MGMKATIALGLGLALMVYFGLLALGAITTHLIIQWATEGEISHLVYALCMIAGTFIVGNYYIAIVRVLIKEVRRAFP